MKILLTLFLLFFQVSALAKDISNPQSRCIEQTCFPLLRNISEQTIPLLGAGLLEYWRMNVYTAGFYTAKPKTEPNTNLAKYPMLLSIHYHRYLKAKWIVDAAIKSLKKNPQVNFKSIQSQVDEMGKAYVDVDKGDVYELSYTPQTGTSLLLNGKHLVTIPGEEFAVAYFGIWLSDSPINENLKGRLLGQKV